jgi:hypothetical protein
MVWAACVPQKHNPLAVGCLMKMLLCLSAAQPLLVMTVSF